MKAGEAEWARQLFFRLIPVNAAVTAQYGIGELKVAMELIGLYGGKPRLPLRRPEKKACEDIAQIFHTAGLC